MSAIVIPLISELLTTTPTKLYEVPADQEDTLTVTGFNYTGTETALSLWVVGDGETRGDEHKRIPAHPMAANSVLDLLREVPLAEGTEIWGAAAVDARLAVQITGRLRATA